MSNKKLQAATKDHPKYFDCLPDMRGWLKRIVEHGLNPCYNNFEEAMDDFWPGHLSWTPEVTLLQCEELLADPEWSALAAQIKEKYEFDWAAEIKHGVQEIQNEWGKE